MSAGLESRCHDYINTGFLQRDSLIPRRRGANRNDALTMTLLENLLRRNAEDEREDRHLGIEQNAHLIFETNRLVWRELRLARAKRLKMRSYMRQSTFEGCGIGRCRTLILRRNPQIHSEGLIGQRTDFGDDFLNRRRSQTKRAERTQTAKV